MHGATIKKRETILKNSKDVLFLSSSKVGQAGNFWTHPRITALCCMITTAALPVFTRHDYFRQFCTLLLTNHSPACNICQHASTILELHMVKCRIRCNQPSNYTLKRHTSERCSGKNLNVLTF